MALWESIREVRDNPVYRMECRRQWRGGRVALVALGIFCAGCSFVLPFLLAPAVAASALTRDRRSGVWNDFLLTRLSSEEILLGRLLPALQIPAAVALASLLWTLASTLGMARLSGQPVSLAVLAASVPAMVAVAAGLVAGGMFGLLAGLGHRDGIGAITTACLLSAGIEVVAVVAAVRLVGSNASLIAWHGAPTTGEAWGLWAFGCAVFTLVNALAAAALWYPVRRRIRAE